MLGRSIVLGLITVLGCSDGGGTTPDGGARPDAGAASDGGEGFDGGATSDGGGRRDSGVLPGDWMPPVGIPAPGFGIEVDPGAGCPTRSSRTQGDLSGLSDLPAGTVVEITGGPHTASRLVIGGTGTAACPIIVRGPTAAAKTIIEGYADIRGSYVVVENLDFDLSSASEGISLAGDHLAFRHSDAHGFRPGHNSTVVFVDNSSDVVLYDLHVWDNGDFAFVGEQDVHGVGASVTHRMWVVDSLIHRNRGDSIQLGHQADNTLGDFYIGRNDMYDNGENSVDIKEASNVVISQNDLHDPPDGYPIVVLHDCPINAAVIYNTVHSAGVGVNTASLEANCDDDVPIDIFVLRNTFRNISDTAVQSWGTGKRYFITGNTFESVALPVDVDPAEPGSTVSAAEDGLTAAFAAFQSVYGIDISAP